MKRYPQLTSDIFNTPWMIQPGKLELIAAVLDNRLRGLDVEVSEDEQQKWMAHNKPTHHTGQSIAVIPLFGTIHQHADMVMDASGGTSTTSFRQQFRTALASDGVGTIVLQVHSPGGSVYDIQNLSAEIFAARDRKRIVAVADSVAASAAYYVASAASEFVITPGGEVGSIGVVQIHRDVSGAEEREGVHTTLIATPQAKVDGHPYAPISETAYAEAARVNELIYDQMLRDIARNRGTTKATVRDNFGGGKMLQAEEAKAAGMVDRVASFGDTIARIQSRARGRGNQNRQMIAELN